MDMYKMIVMGKVRFEVPNKAIQIAGEDLFDLPLTSETGKANLDDMYVFFHEQLQKITASSYVKKSQNSKKRAELELKLSIVKDVIDTKITEAEAAVKEKQLEQQRELLRDAITAREREDLLKNTPIEELKAKLNAIGG